MSLSKRELELIDGMIEVQLDHANRCDTIANRVMADKQKGWDLERVALLEKIKNTRATDPLMEKMAEALEGVVNIISDSWGVSGYHRNGDLAEWEEFEEVDLIQQVLQEYRERKDA